MRTLITVLMAAVGVVSLPFAAALLGLVLPRPAVFARIRAAMEGPVGYLLEVVYGTLAITLGVVLLIDGTDAPYGWLFVGTGTLIFLILAVIAVLKVAVFFLEEAVSIRDQLSDVWQVVEERASPSGLPTPALGRIVLYRSNLGNYTLPAVILATRRTLWRRGVERGDVPAITDDARVHLHVLTPGQQGAYSEFDVPPAREHGPDAGEQEPGTYRWPVA